MSDCGCQPSSVETAEQRRVLRVTLWLNATMFVARDRGAIAASSIALAADWLDMLSDAAVYAVALVAIARSDLFKSNAATASGISLLLLGGGVFVEAVRRLILGGSPEGTVMIAVATLALAVNFYVLRLLSRLRRDEVHLKASWIFTRADVVANAGVIASGALTLTMGWSVLDALAGAAIGLFVCREAFEILSEARSAQAEAKSAVPNR